MLYWLIYDISENGIRNRIVSICKNYGFFRVQKSSFMGNLSRNKMEMLALEIKNLDLGEEDCIFIIPSCRSCFSGKDIIGHLDEERVKQKDFVIIGK
jgi:CRISPR-associated protein Cas2